MKLPQNFTPHKPTALDNLVRLRNYPYYVMPKLDGLRCIIVGGKILSNSLKPFPNKFLNALLKDLAEYLSSGGAEGEIVIQGGTHQDVQSVVMSEEGSDPNLRLVLFDRYVGSVFGDTFATEYRIRLMWLEELLKLTSPWTINYLRMVHYKKVYTQAEIETVEQLWVDMGFEGIVLRSPDDVYKFGRATEKEDTFWKYKRTEDAEAIILDTLQLQHNLNEEKINERGYTERASFKHNKIDSGVAGSLLVKGINGRYKDKIFKVSLGSKKLTERVWFWQNREQIRARTITYTYAKHRGTDDAPAEPRFKDFRNTLDLTK
jgi:DNA ligase-1